MIGKVIGGKPKNFQSDTGNCKSGRWGVLCKSVSQGSVSSSEPQRKKNKKVGTHKKDEGKAPDLQSTSLNKY